LDGLQTAAEWFGIGTTGLAWGGSVPAGVAAFRLDERTLPGWLSRGAEDCQGLHEAVLSSRPLDWASVQADASTVKTKRGRVWRALALRVRPGRWLGGGSVRKALGR
jgi:hypothetical protein